METLLLGIGRLAGAIGVLACLIAIGARLAGFFWVAGLQTSTLFQAGMAAMILGCLGVSRAERGPTPRWSGHRSLRSRLRPLGVARPARRPFNPRAGAAQLAPR
jgi:hypothetical protein